LGCGRSPRCVKGVDDAFSRQVGVNHVTVQLQDGVILVDTDARRSVRPSAFWRELSRIGFAPVSMEVWATGTIEGDFFDLDDSRWPLSNGGSATTARRRRHFRVLNAGEDPPRVEALD
jgi:hypothetical protein